MLKKIIQFIKYHNAFTIGLILLFAMSGVIFASDTIREATIGKAVVEKAGIDNTALLAADLDNFDFSMKINNVTEDEENYYVLYTYKTLDIQNDIWQPVSRQETLEVSKSALADRDLGLYVAEELGEIIDSQKAYLVKVQQKQKEKGVTLVQETTKYTGLIGMVLNPKTRELPGYKPVVKPLEPVAVVYTEPVLNPASVLETPLQPQSQPQSQSQAQPTQPMQPTQPSGGESTESGSLQVDESTESGSLETTTTTEATTTEEVDESTESGSLEVDESTESGSLETTTTTEVGPPSTSTTTEATTTEEISGESGSPEATTTETSTTTETTSTEAATTTPEITCVPEWQCNDWQGLVESFGCGEIFNQTRTCTDINECGTDESKPVETQEAIGTDCTTCGITSCDASLNLTGECQNTCADGSCQTCTPTCSCADGFYDCDNDGTCETQGQCPTPEPESATTTDSG